MNDEIRYHQQNFPWYNKPLIRTWKWRLKLSPGADILKSLENFIETKQNNVEVGFAEFRLLGSVWADSVEYAISEEFGKVKPFVLPISDANVFNHEEGRIASWMRKQEKEKMLAKLIKSGKTLNDLTEEEKKRYTLTSDETSADGTDGQGNKLDLSKRKKLEVLFCWGTVSKTNELVKDPTDPNPPHKAKAHGHITFAEEGGRGNAFGGHLLKAKVSIVAEVIIDILTTKNDYLGTENWNMSSKSEGYFVL